MKLRLIMFTVMLLLIPAFASGQMIYYGNLYVHSNGADAYSYAVVPYGWIQANTLQLSEDGTEIDYDYGRSYYNGQAVYLSVSHYGYPPPYTSYEVYGEVEGELSDYGWFWDTFYANGVTPAPTVTISSGGDTYDGASGAFGLSVQGGSPTEYEWLSSYPQGSGNNPNVTFNGADSSVSTNAHWFAYPNGECTASFSPQYQIFGQALIAGQWYGDSTPFTIYVPQRGGETHSPQVSGSVQILCSNGVCTVGANNYYRTQPMAVINVLPSSQFRVKVETHEGNHVHQHTAGMFSQNWDPLTVYNLVRNFTDTSSSVLSDRVTAALDSYNDEQDATVQSQWLTAEMLAYSVSNSIPPLYLFQSTCGGQ